MRKTPRGPRSRIEPARRRESIGRSIGVRTKSGPRSNLARQAPDIATGGPRTPRPTPGTGAPLRTDGAVRGRTDGAVRGRTDGVAGPSRADSAAERLRPDIDAARRPSAEWNPPGDVPPPSGPPEWPPETPQTPPSPPDEVPVDEPDEVPGDEPEEAPGRS